MKKIVLPIILLITICSPITTHAICDSSEIQQYKSIVANIKMDVDYDKNPAFNTGEYDKSTEKEKGMFIVKFDNIPEGYTITVYSGDFFKKFNNLRRENSGFAGGIYNVKYSNDKCKNVSLREHSFYLPTYSGDKDGKIWDDATIYTPPKEEKKSNSTIILVIILILILIAFAITVIIIKKRKGGIGKHHEDKI